MNINNEEFQHFCDLNGIAVWLCHSCRTLLNTMNTGEGHDDSESPINISSLSECVKHLRNKIIELSENQEHLNQYMKLLNEVNVNLKTALSNQAEAISDILVCDARQSYASKLKNPMIPNLASKLNTDGQLNFHNSSLTYKAT